MDGDMAEPQDQFDEGLTSGDEQRLGTQLKALYGQRVAVPGVVDEAIRARAHAALQKQGRAHPATRRMAWWLGSGVAAAAAAITLAVVLWPEPGAVQPHISANDLNRDGRVNMLDAYALARRVAMKQPVGKELDFNRDGVVDSKDADVIAHEAVSLKAGGTAR